MEEVLVLPALRTVPAEGAARGATVRNARAKPQLQLIDERLLHPKRFPRGRLGRLSSSWPAGATQIVLLGGLFPHNGASFQPPFLRPDQPPSRQDVLQNAPLSIPIAH